MKGKKIIAIDIDDVIADSTESLRLLVNERIGANLTPEHYRIPGEYWGYYERVWKEHGLADRITYSDLEAEMEYDQSHVPLLAGASFAISELSKQFHVVIITARDKSWEDATRTWFKTHFNKNTIDFYFCDSHKDSRAKTKGQLCKELGAELLVDDNPGHCQTAIDEGIRAILFGAYGWQNAIPQGVVSCKTWPDVLEYINNGAK